MILKTAAKFYGIYPNVIRTKNVQRLEIKGNSYNNQRNAGNENDFKRNSRFRKVFSPTEAVFK